MCRKRTFVLLLVGALFLLSSVACSVGGLLGGGKVDLPDRQVEVSEQAAQEAKEIIDRAKEGGSIRLTESQFTSFLVEGMRNKAGEDLPLQDLTVWFEPGQVIVRAQVSGEDLPTSGEMIMVGNLSVQDGKLQFSLDKASVNGVSVPKPVLGVFNTVLNEALAETDISKTRIKSISLEPAVIVIERE